MESKTLILTVGLPRSGKSTWAKKENLPIVNPDSIRLALHGKAFIPEAEDIVWATAYLMAKALFLAGHDAVIIDATNITLKRQSAWVNKFKDFAIQYQEFPSSVEICKERAIQSNRKDLIPIIDKMEGQRDFDWGKIKE